LTPEETRSPIIQDQVKLLKLAIETKIGDQHTDDEVFNDLGDEFPGTIESDIFDDEYPDQELFETSAEQLEAEDEAGEHFDKFLTADVQLERGDNILRG
jgi:hypothetical protein